MPETVNTVDGLVATEVQLRLLILGSYDTLGDLQTAHAVGNEGDAYMIGEHCYIWDVATSTWVDIGTLKGPATYTHIKYSSVADPGDSDMTDTPSTYLGIYTGTASVSPPTASLYKWVKIVGADGAPGKNLTILGTYPTITDLLTGATSPSAGDAYFVGSSAPYLLYIWDETSTAWVNCGSFAPASHVGATGAAHGVATVEAAGFMSAADKTKLDGLSGEGALTEAAVNSLIFAQGL